MPCRLYCQEMKVEIGGKGDEEDDEEKVK